MQTSDCKMTKRMVTRPALQPSQQGATLIEAIVALVILATTGMALFSWINSNMITLVRVQEINAENEATINAVEYLSGINPMVTPEGKVDLGPYKFQWKSQAETEPRDGAGYPYGVSLYQFNMYQTKVTVEKSDGQKWFDFTLPQVGYKKVRDMVVPG